MAADLAEKTGRYRALLEAALDAAEPAAGLDGDALDDAGAVEEMARAYLEDGRHFADEGDLVDALAAFAYGHGWLDAGARLGLFDVPTEGHLFTV